MEPSPATDLNFVVTVDFRILPAFVEVFRKRVCNNARLSRENEPGCLQFDVVLPDNAPDRVFLYEIYSDREAFETHKRMPHFLSFDRETVDHVIDKRVITGTRIRTAELNPDLG